MRVWAQWHGGINYAAPDMSHLERFASLANAREAFTSRRYQGYWIQQTFAYVDRPLEIAFTPNVESDSELWLYFRDPRGERDPWPDERMYFGPRGGVHRERC